MASGRVGGEGGGADLSAEQVRRIEENRKRAQERLAVRRGVGAHQTGGLDSRVISQSTPRGGPNFKPPPSSGPPPATITRHLTDAVSTAVRTNSHDSAASSSAGFYSRSTSKPTPPPFSQGRIPGPGTTCHAPFDSSTSHSQSFPVVTSKPDLPRPLLTQPRLPVPSRGRLEPQSLEAAPPLMDRAN